VGGGKMPDAKTMGRCDVVLEPDVLKRDLAMREKSAQATR
jgi:hypothetical protein